MRNIPAAKGSPRIENGVILFTEGDTFDLKIHLKFHDSEGTQYVISPTDSIDFTVYDETGEEVETQEFESIEDDTVVLSFTDSNIDKYIPGTYRYSLTLKSDFLTTVVLKNKIIVEGKSL